MRESNWDKQIIQNFDAAANNYNTEADIQKEVALKLATVCSIHSIPPGIWVDLASGTGLLAECLERLNPNQSIIRLDKSVSMLDQQPREKIKQIWDLNKGLPEWDKSPTLFSSSFGLHWLRNPPNRLKEWRNALSPEGWIALAVPVEGSFSEWHEAAQKANVPCTATPLPTSKSLFDVVKENQIHHEELYQIKQVAPTATSLFKPMIKVGAKTSPKPSLSIGEWRKLTSNWPLSSINKSLTLTWTIQLLLIKK